MVVIQTNLLNDAGHPSTLICPLTTQVQLQSKWLRVHLKKGEAGLADNSDVMMDQIRAIDNRRFKMELGTLSKENRIHLRESLKVILDL